MKTLVLLKNSVVYTDASVEYQCKEKGHHAYNYEIEIETGLKLDDQDFIIDHSLVHEEIKHVIQNDMGSCERLCLRIEERLRKTLDEHGCQVHRLNLLIKPAGSNAWVMIKADYSVEKLASSFTMTRQVNILKS